MIRTAPGGFRSTDPKSGEKHSVSTIRGPLLAASSSSNSSRSKGVVAGVNSKRDLNNNNSTTTNRNVGGNNRRKLPLARPFSPTPLKQQSTPLLSKRFTTRSNELASIEGRQRRQQQHQRFSARRTPSAPPATSKIPLKSNSVGDSKSITQKVGNCPPSGGDNRGRSATRRIISRRRPTSKPGESSVDNNNNNVAVDKEEERRLRCCSLNAANCKSGR